MILFSNHIRGKSLYNENRNKSVHMFLSFFFFFSRHQIQGIEWIITGSYLSLESAVNL